MESYNSFIKFLVTLLLLTTFALQTSARPGTDSSDTTSTTPTGTPAIFKKLEQLKQMEESTLKGWYELVKRFLHSIKSDNQTFGVILDYVQGKEEFVAPDGILKLASMNTAFLAMVVIGIIYVVVMLLCGLFFLFCRCCGRCGSKNSQRQRSNMGCWRTTHKFCLVLMITLLVIPFVCMCIINEHMKQSLPNAKSNATEVFTILIDYANDTQKEINDFEKNMEESRNEENLQPYFEENFVSPVKVQISELINERWLDEIKSVVDWLVSVKEKNAEVASMANISIEIQNLKDQISELKLLFERRCSENEEDWCSEFKLDDLAIGKIDLEHDIKPKMESIKNKFNKLVKYSDLQAEIEKIQNNTMLSDVFSENKNDFKKLYDEFGAQEKEEFRKIAIKINAEIEKIKEFLSYTRETVEVALYETDSYEVYRWWTMFGVALALIIPVVFLILGLICGCCGYEKDRHPTKRSSISHCGGSCLILAVYCFFLISSVLMLFTIGLFVIGGSLENFVCAPLYEDNLHILDQVKEKFDEGYNDNFKGISPSKLLKHCHNSKPIFEVLDLQGFINVTRQEVIMTHVGGKLESSDITAELNKTILMKTDEIKEYFDNFTNALNLNEMKYSLEQLQRNFTNSKNEIVEVSETVISALENNNDKDLEEFKKHFSELLKDINALEMKLMNFATMLRNISEKADYFKGKIEPLRGSLPKTSKELLDIVKGQLVIFAVGYVQDIIQQFKSSVGQCSPIWVSFDTARTVICQFAVNPVNGYWFGLGWSLLFIIPTIIIAVKLSRHYIKMKYDDDIYVHEGEAVPLEEMNRPKPFSYTHQGSGGGWMPHNYVVHPASGNQARQFNYK